MTLIEKLISSPSEESRDLLYEGDSEIFWVDWREDDSALAEYVESIIKSNKLSASMDNDKLFIHYGEVTKQVPLSYSGSDRHITLVAINDILYPEYETRMVWESDGNDTLAFTPLSIKQWSELETRYGVEAVNKAFLKLSPNLNTFTDSLHGHRPI